jgi:DNA-directed RNA polymerase specialized sigma24 family protein
MRAPGSAFPEPLRPEQVEELLRRIEWLAARWEIPLPALRRALREALMDLSRQEPQGGFSDEDWEHLASLRAGLRQLAEALADPLPPAPEPVPNEKIEILIDVLLRAWILERYPGHSVAWWALLWERHGDDIARGLRPFRGALVEAGELAPRSSLKEHAADFLGLLYQHLSERDEARLRQWDPLKGPMGPWLREVVWQLAWDRTRLRHPELPLEPEEGEDAEGLPWAERIEDPFFSWEEIDRVLDLEGPYERLRKALNRIDWLILNLAAEGWTDAEIAERLAKTLNVRMRRETVNRRKQRARRQAFCVLWKEWVREEDLPDPRIERVVAAYGEGGSAEEIARRLGIPVQELEALIAKARRILRDRLI